MNLGGSHMNKFCWITILISLMMLISTMSIFNMLLNSDYDDISTEREEEVVDDPIKEPTGTRSRAGNPIFSDDFESGTLSTSRWVVANGSSGNAWVHSYIKNFGCN